MSKNSISFDEVKNLFVAFSKDHPGWTAIGAGIGCGLAYAIPKLSPTFENCWKYTVDKVVDCFPKATSRSVLAEESIDDDSTADLPYESNAT